VLLGAPLSGLKLTTQSLARSLSLSLCICISHAIKHGTDLRSEGRGFLLRTAVDEDFRSTPARRLGVKESGPGPQSLPESIEAERGM
jgi:hypothetical protein